MALNKVGNKTVLTAALGFMVFSVVLILISLIIGFIPAIGYFASSIIQIIAFCFSLTGIVLSLLSGHKKFLWALFAYFIMLILTIVFMFVGPDKGSGAIAIQVMLYAVGALAKLLVLLGYKDINDKYASNNKINSMLIFLCIAVAICEIIFDLINFAVPSTGTNLTIILNSLGIVSEVLFVFVLFFTYKALKHKN